MVFLLLYFSLIHYCVYLNEYQDRMRSHNSNLSLFRFLKCKCKMWFPFNKKMKNETKLHPIKAES